MQTFKLSMLEVEQHIAFVASKIKEYRFRRHQPPLECDTDFDRRWNRRALLENLRKLGPEYLSTSLLLPKVGVQRVATPKELKEAARQVRVME